MERNWREVLQVKSFNVPRSAIDVNYWLSYAQGEHVTPWFTNAENAVEDVLFVWQHDGGDPIPSSDIPKILVFAQDFIKVYGIINTNILLAFITQAT